MSNDLGFKYFFSHWIKFYEIVDETNTYCFSLYQHDANYIIKMLNKD